MTNDDFVPSYVSKHLEQLGRPPTAQEEHTIKWTAATMYGAGADTVSNQCPWKSCIGFTGECVLDYGLTDSIGSLHFLSTHGPLS